MSLHRSGTRDFDGTGTRDNDLLFRVATGDRAAFSDLSGRFSGRVYGLALRVVCDPAHAEEIVQEVLLEVWRTAARFDPVRGSAGTWVLTITHRRAVDRVRSEQASRERTGRIGVRDRQRAFDVVSEQVILREEHTEVRAALAVLTRHQRQVIELAYFQGHTYREVAQMLDMPLGTVKARIRNGLLGLREAISERVTERAPDVRPRTVTL